MQSAAWHVVATQPRAEHTAELNLARQGFPAFCPRFRKTRRHARRVDTVLAPVFPGYLFVRFDKLRDAWRSINGTHGVLHLVGPSQMPHAMPEAAMAELLARCEKGVMRCVLPDLNPGRQVRVASGPFADRLATIDQLDERGRVRVLLDILGGTASIGMELHDLVPA